MWHDPMLCAVQMILQGFVDVQLVAVRPYSATCAHSWAACPPAVAALHVYAHYMSLKTSRAQDSGDLMFFSAC